ncbi:MAG: hypothetical protein L0196_02975 [candidate division Zixibacteria bacterium]|nr:hypothetical protein [candidate division Zixibacteria bacterium]
MKTQSVRFKLAMIAVVTGLSLLASFNGLFGVTQFSRKYDIECNACHTSFPRLTYFGEQFQRNGYQLPGEADGDEKEKQAIGANLFVDRVENFFGIRMSLTPLEVKTKSLVHNNDTITAVNIGKADWLQLFTAGSIFKNTSIFIETEITTSAVKVNWFYLGFHRPFGTSDLVHLRIGQLSPMEWHGISGRLRMIPNVNIQAVSGVQSSNGKGKDSQPLASAFPSLELYGWQGPVLYSVGISNGPKATDPNQFKNFFGTLRFEATGGSFAGSSVSFWGFRGYDTKDDSTLQKLNNYWRASPGFNLRYRSLDVTGAFFYGEDGNWTLATTAQKNSFRGGAVQVGYNISPRVYGILQYDEVNSHLSSSLDFRKITPSIWYMARQNMRLGLTGRVDLLKETTTHPAKIHELIATVRTMF